VQTERKDIAPERACDGAREEGYPFDWRLAALVALLAAVMAAAMFGPALFQARL